MNRGPRAVALTMALFSLTSATAEELKVRSDAMVAPGSAFREWVSLPQFMEHVLTPAADIVWRASGTAADLSGERDLTPRSVEQWEEVVSGAAGLAEATNALMIPQRVRDGAWTALARALANSAMQAFQAAEAHDAAGIALAGEHIDGACTGCHRYYGVE